MESKKFEIPELTIILFEGDLATDEDIVGTSGPEDGLGDGDKWYD